MMTQMEKMNKQVGGNHYKIFSIQPVHMIQVLNLTWFEGEILKYVSRFPFKNGKQDLLKALSLIKIADELDRSKEYKPVMGGYKVAGDIPIHEHLIDKYVSQFGVTHGKFVKACINYILRSERSKLERFIENNVDKFYT